MAKLPPLTSKHPRDLGRTGPRPLPLHLLTALTLTQTWPLVWQNLSSGLPPSSANPQRHSAKWVALASAAKKFPSGSVERALHQAALNRLGTFITGIRRYRDAIVTRELTEPPVLWQEGATRLLDFAPQNKKPLLIIPSLINRWHVLDLSPSRSLMRWLAEQGFRPLLVDWGTPGESEMHFGFGEYLARLTRCLDLLKLRENAGQLPFIGYCLGGTLAVALAAMRPVACQKLVLLATPWDFHCTSRQNGLTGYDKDLPAQAQNVLNALEPWLSKGAMVPVDALQALLTSLHPAHVMRKFTAFAQSKGEAQLDFVLLEDWLNDGVPLTAKAATELFRDLYALNLPGSGRWMIEGTVVAPHHLVMPALVVVPGNDRIVPPASARVLAKLLPNATLLEQNLGHVGMIVGSGAQARIWEPLRDWLHSLESPS